jgi:hypothetical protein
MIEFYLKVQFDQKDSEQLDQSSKQIESSNRKSQRRVKKPTACAY